MVEWPRKYAGDDRKQTKYDQTGHHQPIARADFCHLISPHSHPEEARS